jgi:hypothetical protein
MFEPPGTETFLGLCGAEWEALSFGIDGALDGDLDWQTSLNKQKEVCNGNTSYNTCRNEIHYFRAGFSGVRFLQNYWVAILAAGGSTVTGIVYLKTNLFNGG